MQSRKPKYSVHSLLIDAEYGPRQSSPEVSLCRLESLKERNGAVWGRTDRQTGHPTPLIWKCLGKPRPCPGPQQPLHPQARGDCCLGTVLECRAGWMLDPAPQHNEQGTAGLPGPLGCHLRPRAGFLPYLGNSALRWVKTAEGSMQHCSRHSAGPVPHAQAFSLALLGSAPPSHRGFV